MKRAIRKNYHKFTRDEALGMRGAALVEVSLMLTVFVAILMALLWLGLTMNARTSLTLSLGQALRYGVTRGLDSPFSGRDDFNEQIANYQSGGIASVDAAYQERFKRLLYRRGASDTEADTDFNESVLDTFVNTPAFAPLTLRDMPATYIRALIGMHEFMRLKVGTGFLAYPCDNRPGCLGCRLLNPAYTNNAAQICSDAGRFHNNECFVSPDDRWPTTKPEWIPAGRIVMRCTYVPDFGLLRPFMLLLGGAAERKTITRMLNVVHTPDI